MSYNRRFSNTTIDLYCHWSIVLGRIYIYILGLQHRSGDNVSMSCELKRRAKHAHRLGTNITKRRAREKEQQRARRASAWSLAAPKGLLRMGTCVGVRSGGPTSGAHASCPPPWQQGLQLRGERSGCGQYVRTKYKTTSKFWNSINTVNTHLNDTCIVLSLATSFFLSVSISNMSINWPSRAIDLWFGTIPDLLNTPHNRQSWCSLFSYISNMSLHRPFRAIDLWFGTITDLSNISNIYRTTQNNRQSWCSHFKALFSLIETVHSQYVCMYMTTCHLR